MIKYNLQYAIIMNLQGEYKLKQLDKAEKAYDAIEFELYDNTMQGIKSQFKGHLNELKELGYL